VLTVQVPRSIQPSKARPGRDEPALLPHVLKAVATVRGETEEQAAKQTTDVACKFFGLPRAALSILNGMEATGHTNSDK
jgi:TatD DNase family protein